MARYTGPKERISRRLGVNLFLKGERALTDKSAMERRPYPPGQHGRARQKQSEYREQLQEKQKARYYYGVLERQFRNYFAKAVSKQGPTGENLLRLLECRLDNVVYRLGFAATRAQARQFVVHRHFTVNGRRVNIPSYQVRPGDIVAIREGAKIIPAVHEATEMTASVAPWLQADHENLVGKVLRHPLREEIDTPVQEQLIVELYSK
jgi:small subunit ribosomal protein S4